MSFGKRSGWPRRYMRVAATLMCVGSSAIEAAPALNSSRPQPSSGTPDNKPSSKTPPAPTRKTTTGIGAKQPASSSKTIDNKVGERAAGNQDSWPPPPVPGRFAPDKPLDTSIPPPSLPRASRLRMRACAEEWTKKKLLTRNDLPRWRDFATGCFNRKDKP